MNVTIKMTIVIVESDNWLTTKVTIKVTVVVTQKGNIRRGNDRRILLG